MTSLLIRVDTTVNTNVKGSKVFGLAFVKVAGVTDVFTQDEVRAFVLPKLSAEPETLVGSAIVQLDNVSSGGENANHSGRGDERFTGVLTKVFSNGLVDDTVTTNMADVTGAAGVDVYFLTMDGINETAVRMTGAPPLTLPIYGYRDFTKRFDSTVTLDNVGDKFYTAVTNYELTNPVTDLLTISTRSELVIEASDSYEISSTERMLLNPVVVPAGYISYNFSEMYPNAVITMVSGTNNEQATFTNVTNGLSGYYNVESGGSSGSQSIIAGLFTDRSGHFHTSSGVYTNFIDIDFGTTCLIDKIKYFANQSSAPQECYVFTSDTEINGNVSWPSSMDYFTNVDTNGIVTVNGIVPDVMSEHLSKTKQDLNSNPPFFGATDVPMSAHYIPWLNNELGRVLVGRYVRMYIQQKHAKRYDSSYTNTAWVGADLIQCFGKPTTLGATMTYNLSNARGYITQYYDTDVNTTTRFVVNDLTIADQNQPLPTQFYNYSWTTNASSTSLIQYNKTPVNAQVLLNPIVTYSQGTSNSIVIDTSQSSYMTDTVFENWFPYRLYPTDTTFTHVPKGTFVWPDDNSMRGEAYTFTNSTNGLSGYYKFSNTYDNKWSSKLFAASTSGHYHSENGYNKIIIDIDLGAICNVSKMTYYASNHFNGIPTCQQMAIYVSENEIHGTAGWPNMDSEEPYIGTTTTNGVTPIVLKPIEGTYNTSGINQPYILSDNNILKYQSDDNVHDRPLMEHETDFGTGRYVRVYMRRMKAPLAYVGGILLAFFGSQV